MDKAIAGDGMMSVGSQGQPVAHPLLTERRLHVALVARLLRQLDLPADDDDAGVPPTGGHPDLTGPRRRNRVT